MSGSNQGYVLQNRDRHLLTIVGMLRYIDREQAKLAGGFGSTTRVNTRLLALVQMRLLKRFFVGTSVGTKKSIYALTPSGSAVAGLSHRRVRMREGDVIGSDLFLEHQLQINNIYFALLKTPPGLQVESWKTFDERISPTINLKPDAYLELHSTVVRPVFLEVDLGTETRKIWKRKVREYLTLALSGEFTRLFHQSQFRVLVITTSKQRTTGLLKVIAEQTEKIFFVTTFENINRESIWNSIWQRPGNPECVSLL